MPNCLKYLIQKEFIQIRRNPFLPRLIVAFPIVIMCVMPWVMNMEVKNIVAEVVDNDRSTPSRRLVQHIEASPYFIFGGQQSTYAASLHDIETSRADLTVVIPRHYGRDLETGRQPQVFVAANAVNGMKGSMGAAYMSQIIGSASAQAIAAASVSGGNYSLPSPLGEGSGVRLLYNPHQNYKVFMIPALFAILLMLLCGFLPALNIVSEKESGTIEQINVTPVPKWTFILAKLIPYWVIAFFVLTVCLLLSWAVYGITCQGPLPLVYLLAMLLALVFSSFGLIISNYSDTLQQAILVMWFFVVCLILLSGLFTPVRSMPHWAYLTTYVNPMHYFIDAIRTVFVRGGSFAAIAHQVLALAVCASLLGLWAIVSYRKNH